MSSELMKKAAQVVRQLGAENESLKSRIDELEGTASSLNELTKKASAAEIVVNLVADGDVDPDDALEKFAEVSELSAEQIKLVLRKKEAENIGHIKVASAASDGDPLTAYLLGF